MRILVNNSEKKPRNQWRFAKQFWWYFGQGQEMIDLSMKFHFKFWTPGLLSDLASTITTLLIRRTSATWALDTLSLTLSLSRSVPTLPRVYHFPSTLWKPGRLFTGLSLTACPPLCWLHLTSPHVWRIYDPHVGPLLFRQASKLEPGNQTKLTSSRFVWLPVPCKKLSAR